MSNYHGYVAVGLFIVIAVAIGWAALYTPLLRDASKSKKPPYSLARTQLLWWTAIIATVITVSYGLTGELAALNETCLALLGISLGTTGLAKVIDNSDEAADVVEDSKGAATAARSPPPERHQDKDSDRFFRDIISDENGPSTHRLQVVVFSTIYGALFLSRFLHDPSQPLPTFGNFELALLGLSSGAYLYVKNTENG